MRVITPISNPLCNDQEIHPSEESPEEQNLRKEFEEEVDGLPEMDGVECLHEYTERHVANSNND